MQILLGKMLRFLSWGLGLVALGAGLVHAWFFMLYWGNGFWGVFFGVLVLPLTVVLSPLVTLVDEADWLPLIVIWGGGISAFFIKSLNRKISNVRM